jgi:SSS family solute:Na+ symporter
VNQLPIVDLIVIAVYFAATMGVGVYFMRRSRSSAAFMAAGGSLGSFLVGMSIFATFVSSISFLGNPGNSYALDWSRFTFGISIPLAAWFATRFFVPLYRKQGDVSAYAYLERRFGRTARVYASLFYLLTQLGRMGSVLYLVALALSALLGMDVWLLIAIVGVSTMIYAMLGGIEGVIWVDAIQGLILIGGALLCAILLLFGMPDGPGQIFSIAAANSKFSLGSADITDLTTATFWVILMNGVFINLNNFGIDQNYIQRYLTARSEKEAGRAVWFGGLLYVPVSAVFFFIGTALYAFYTAQPDRLAAGLEADKVFPHFIVNELPAGVTGLLIAAILAAAMSTVSTSLNSSATIFFTDFYKRYFRPAVSERESMTFLYIVTFLWGIAGIGIACWMIGSKSALDEWWKWSSVFSGGMLGLFLLGAFSRKAGNEAAMTGMAVGLALILWMTLSGLDWWQASPRLSGLASPFSTLLVVVLGTTALLASGLLASALVESLGGRLVWVAAVSGIVSGLALTGWIWVTLSNEGSASIGLPAWGGSAHRLLTIFLGLCTIFCNGLVASCVLFKRPPGGGQADA